MKSVRVAIAVIAALVGSLALSVNAYLYTPPATTLPPSGAAGGALTGTYPDPGIATNAVTTAKILDANVTLAKIATQADQTVLGNVSGGAASPIALSAAQLQTLVGVSSGLYTPTLSGSSNLDSSSALEAQWLRVGNVVTVSGSINMDPTTPAAVVLEMSLPVASNLADVGDLGGAATNNNIAGASARIIGLVANDTAVVQFIATDTANRTWAFIFQYRVI